MRRFVKILALILCLVLLSVPAMAADGVQGASELVTLNRQMDIVVSVLYETQEPGITLIAPDGRIFAQDTDYAVVERGDHAVYFYIDDAPAGAWYIRVDKRDDRPVDVSVFPWERPISIDSLTVSGVEDGYVNGEAVVSGYEGSFRYDIYVLPVLPDGSLGGRVDLANRSAWGSSTLRIRESVSSLPDGEYRLGMEAYYVNESGSEVPTFAVSEGTFTVSGATVPGDPGGLTAVLDITQSTLELNWTAGEYRISDWTLTITPAGSPGEVYYTAQRDGNTLSASLLVDQDVGDLDVTVTGTIRSGGWLEYTRHVSWDDGVELDFETPEITNSLTGVVDFDVKDLTVTAVLTVNGQAQELRLSGAQKLSFQLDSMRANEIAIEYGAQDGMRYRLSRRITVDSLPPALDLFGVTDRFTVSSGRVTLAGSTEPGAALTVNGDKVETDPDGSFKAEVRLDQGENVLTFEAVDAAGNRSVRTVTVVSASKSASSGDTGTPAASSGGSKVPWVLIGSAVAAVLAAASMALFGAVTTRRVKKEERPRAGGLRKLFGVLEGLFCAGTLCSAGAAALLAVHASKTAESIAGANLTAALQQMSANQIAQRAAQVREIRAQALWAGAAAALFLLAMVLLMVLAGLLKKDRTAQPPKPPKPPKAPKTPKAPQAPKAPQPPQASQIPAAPETPRENAAPAPRFCPNCGASVAEDETFCHNCGAKLK